MLVDYEVVVYGTKHSNISRKTI